MTGKNNFEVGRNKLIDTFEVKGFKKWIAREGYGAQATIYHNGKKVAFVTDAGDGGEIEVENVTGIKFNHKNCKSDFCFDSVCSLLNTFPAFTYAERGWKQMDSDELQKWDLETFGDVMLIIGELQKQFKKTMKKVTVVDDLNKVGIVTYNYTSDVLANSQVLVGMIQKDSPNGKILNDLDLKEAFKYYIKYCADGVKQNGDPVIN